VISILILWPMYIVGIQYERGGWWRVVAPITVAAFVLDVALNYTELRLLMWDKPREGEYTFSQRLERLQLETGLRGKVARFIERYMLGPFDPDGYHALASMPNNPSGSANND